MPRRTLVVDTLAERRQRLIRQVLEPAGYQVREAERTNVALALCGDCDIVIAYDQPLDALSLLAQLRADDYDIPLILLTARGSEALAVRAFREGAADYLSEPFRADDLLRRLDATLEQYPERKIVGAPSDLLPEGSSELATYVHALNRVIEVSNAVVAGLLLDDVLREAAAAAATVANADASSILLLDDLSQSLHISASYNMAESATGVIHLPMDDNLAAVLRTGQPVFANSERFRQIGTVHSARSAIPLTSSGRTIGVLAVDSHVTNRPLHDWQVRLLTLLSNLVSIALNNTALEGDSRRDRDKLDAVLRGTEDPVLLVDDDGNMLLHNPAARSLFGIPEDYLGPALGVIDDADLHMLLASPQPQRAEVMIDEQRVYIAQMALVPGVGRVIVMHNISALKELDRLKSNFVASVSQDLRSPLTTILGYVELLTRAGPVNDQQRLFIDRIIMSANAITNLITDLLDLSRIETVSFDTANEDVNLALVVEYALATVEGEVRARQQRLDVQFDTQTLLVSGSPQRLKQMVRNLVQNAVQYTPEGGAIAIRLQAHADLVVLRVEDNGIGIPLDEQPHVFEKFYRASNVQSTYEGAGLGLAIVKSIVDRHNGRIWVESEPGRGSIFTVILPAHHVLVEGADSKPRAWAFHR